MRAQGIISDIVLNIRRGKQNFTFYELFGMSNEFTDGNKTTYTQFKLALLLTVETGEVNCTVGTNSSQFVDTGIFTPGEMF